MAEDLREYFEEILQLLGVAISNRAKFQTESVVDTVAHDAGKLRARIVYDDGSILQVLLTVDFSRGFPNWTHYSFHYQDNAGRFRFRYDDFPHYPGYRISRTASTRVNLRISSLATSRASTRYKPKSGSGYALPTMREYQFLYGL
ncbi:MAG: hypothetical protein HYX80_02500 [Chloroflexi bacterium]|nr:hypothetical protein [Chloroflexota bacterium]